MQVRDKNISPTIRIEINGKVKLKVLYQASKLEMGPNSKEKVLVRENVDLLQTINNQLE